MEFCKSDALPALAVFARAAIPGRTKTRLIPALGRKGAAEFHRALVSDTLHKVLRLKLRIARYLFVTGGSGLISFLPDCYHYRRQRGRDLAERLDQAFAHLLQEHPCAIIIGTDSPEIPCSLLTFALRKLRTTDAVLGPCPDGGYYLLGLRQTSPGLLRRIRLETPLAFRNTIDRLLTLGFSTSILEPYPDVDYPKDYAALQRNLVKNPGMRRLMPATWRFLSTYPTVV